MAGFCNHGQDAESCKEAAKLGSVEKMSIEQVLSPKLKKLLDEDQAATAKEDGVGYLDFDPYLASQDPSPKFVVESVQVKNRRCDALVNGIQDGKKEEKVMPELAKTGEKWRFVNFHYDDSDDLVSGLMGELKSFRDDGKNPK